MGTNNLDLSDFLFPLILLSLALQGPSCALGPNILPGEQAGQLKPLAKYKARKGIYTCRIHTRGRELTESLGTLDNFIKIIRNDSVLRFLILEVCFSDYDVNS